MFKKVFSKKAESNSLRRKMKMRSKSHYGNRPTSESNNTGNQTPMWLSMSYVYPSNDRNCDNGSSYRSTSNENDSNYSSSSYDSSYSSDSGSSSCD